MVHNVQRAYCGVKLLFHFKAGGVRRLETLRRKPCRRRFFPRLIHHAFTYIQPVYVISGLVERDREQPGAAADIQHPAPRGHAGCLQQARVVRMQFCRYPGSKKLS